jgi:hypothetical protein
VRDTASWRYLRGICWMLATGLLFVMAVFATTGHYTFTRAMQTVELTVLQPTLAGRAIIVASITYSANREARTRGAGS